MTSSRVPQPPMTVEIMTGAHLEIRPLSGHPAGLRLVGELDLCCADQLAAALADLPRTGDSVVFELAELEFIDVAGARLFVQTGEWLQQQPVPPDGPVPTLRLESPAQLVRDVLSLFLDTDEVPPTGPIELPLNGPRSQS